LDPAALVPPRKDDPAAVRMTERFQPGGVLHALVSGLIELAVAAVLLAASLLAGDSSDTAATFLAAASALWAVLAVWSLLSALLRARVFAAELDGEAVVLFGLGGARRLRYQELSAVDVTRGRTRLVARNGRGYTVRGVRGRAQGNRFRGRVLALATEAVRGRPAPAAGEPAEAASQAEPSGPPIGTDGEQPPQGPPTKPGDADRLPGAEG
jgi:hypothetical protein